MHTRRTNNINMHLKKIYMCRIFFFSICISFSAANRGMLSMNYRLWKRDKRYFFVVSRISKSYDNGEKKKEETRNAELRHLLQFTEKFESKTNKNPPLPLHCWQIKF